MADWASLPGDLISSIADRVLATNDLDYYMDLRAVCRGWRSATADPKDSPRDPRFRPRQWAMLDEVHQSDARLFVNLGTGRFVRRDLPLLRRYLVVASAGGWSVVLAERTPPHAARVLNPFTGAIVRFEAPVPRDGKFAAHVIGSSPTLVLLSCGNCKIYGADPGSKNFMAHTEQEELFADPIFRLAVEGCIYEAAAEEGGPSSSFLLPEARKILDLAAKQFAEYFAGRAEGQAGRNNRCFIVESAGEMLVLFKVPHGVEVFRVDTGSNLLERVKDLGSRALFLGDCRCLSVDADKFASVEANCIYYVVKANCIYYAVEEEPRCDVCVYSLKDETEVTAGGAIVSLDPIILGVDPPFSEVQLLCSYAFEVRDSELGWHQMGLGHV